MRSSIYLLTVSKLEMGVDYRASILRKRRNEKLGYPPDKAREVVPRTVYFESGFRPFIAIYPDVSSTVEDYGLLPLVKKITLTADWAYSKFKDELDYTIRPFDRRIFPPLNGAGDIIDLWCGHGTNTGGAIDDGIRRKASSIVLITDGQTYFEGCYRKHGCSPQEYAYRKAKEAKENDIHLVLVCVHVDSRRRAYGDEMYDYYGDHTLPSDSRLKRFIDNLAGFSEGKAFHLTPSLFEIGCTKILYDVLEASLKPRIEGATSVIYGHS